VVAKVGQIEPSEVEAQRHFAGQGLALPVFDYQQQVELPPAVGREVCPVHGLRVDILPEEGYTCTCGTPQAVLLMPAADDDLDGVDQAELAAFLSDFAQRCEQEVGLRWDSRALNVARYQGRLVALDFGEIK
jgi:hypothetical protein